MKVFLLGSLLLSVFMMQSAHAIDNWEYHLDLDAGLREDSADWNIAGNLAGTTPNVISELTWTNIRSRELRAGYRFIGDKKWFWKGYFSKGWVYDGENQDSDYDGDNRTLEFSRSNNSADEGSVLDYSISFGAQFRFLKDAFRVTPLVGYSLHEQHFTMQEAQQTVATAGRTPALGGFAGLDSTYNTEWSGPWAGLDLRVYNKKGSSIFAEAEYYKVD